MNDNSIEGQVISRLAEDPRIPDAGEIAVESEGAFVTLRVIEAM